MQMNEAMVLKKAWGDKPYDHPTFEKEYHLSTATGDYVCTRCGKAVWGNPDREKEEEKKDDSQE